MEPPPRAGGGATVGRRGDQRQLDGERRAAADAVAVGAARAAVQLHDVPHDREADPQPAVRARAGAVGLAEAVEHVRQEFGVDARCRCPRRDSAQRVPACDRSSVTRDPAARGR